MEYGWGTFTINANAIATSNYTAMLYYFGKVAYIFFLGDMKAQDPWRDTQLGQISKPPQNTIYIPCYANTGTIYVIQTASNGIVWFRTFDQNVPKSVGIRFSAAYLIV